MLNFKVISIQSAVYSEWLLRKHYAKRMPCVEYAFGLYENGILYGVCTFGPPPRVMNDGECIFKTQRIKTLELNRLCIQEPAPKNSASFFVASCINLLPIKACIVSYADATFGHTGFIYQATNFGYYGLNQIHERQIFYKGKEVHPRTACSMGHTSISEWAKADKNVVLGEYTKKHRYIYLKLTSKEKIKFQNDMIYSKQPYPKTENKPRYDAKYQPITQITLF